MPPNSIDYIINIIIMQKNSKTAAATVKWRPTWTSLNKTRQWIKETRILSLPTQIGLPINLFNFIHNFRQMLSMPYIRGCWKINSKRKFRTYFIADPFTQDGIVEKHISEHVLNQVKRVRDVSGKFGWVCIGLRLFSLCRVLSSIGEDWMSSSLAKGLKDPQREGKHGKGEP